VGLPREVGGIPLDEIGATGLGLTAALEAAQSFGAVRLDGARLVVQGFGSVGRHAARYLAARGVRLVGVSDTHGGRVCAQGFDLDALVAFKASGRSVADFPAGEAVSDADLVAVECDIWIPAARPDVIRADNADRMRTKVIAQGANIPATPDAERRLAQMGVLVLPDFIANAGGVICASVEYHGGTQGAAFASIAEKIAANTREVLAKARDERLLPREAANELAQTRVRAAMDLRRWHRA
jgi:glutamate dehydrogenase (NAD(P)+)